MPKRVYLSAIEVEEEMQKVRNVDGFTGKVEEMAIKTMIETAKQNGKFGDKTLLVLSPNYIHIPEWQRKLRVAKSVSIGSKYNKYKWEVPKILFVNNRLYVIDGMHRIYGAFKGKLENITVEVMADISEKEAIDLFLSQGEARTGMTPADTLGAAIKAGKPEYLLLKSICAKNHIKIKGDDTTLTNQIGILTSISDGINMVRGNAALLDKILKLVNKLEWNGYENGSEGKAYSAKVLRVLKKLYSFHANNEKEMEKILLKNCKGAKYFKNNLVEKWQDSLFDYLSNVIEENTVSSVPIEIVRSERKLKAN